MTHGSATERSETVKDLYEAMAKMGTDSDEAGVLFIIEEKEVTKKTRSLI